MFYSESKEVGSNAMELFLKWNKYFFALAPKKDLALKSVQCCQQKKNGTEIFTSDLTCRETQNEVILCYFADHYFLKKKNSFFI